MVIVLINKFKMTWKGFLQLQMLPDHDAIKTSATKIKEVTKINTICSVLNDHVQPGIKVLAVRGNYIRKLLQIYYTIPISLYGFC